MGHILLWLLGIPVPILLLIFLLRGCSQQQGRGELPGESVLTAWSGIAFCQTLFVGRCRGVDCEAERQLLPR